MLVVTHEPRVAAFADRTVLMRDGVESVRVERATARAPAGGDSLRVSAGEAEPSARHDLGRRRGRAGGRW